MPFSTPRSPERTPRDADRPTNARIAALLLVGALAFAAPASFPDSLHPLEPPDRSSPRGTLETFSASLDTAWRQFSQQDPRFRESVRVTRECLDVSAFPPEVANELATEAALLLKEVLSTRSGTFRISPASRAGTTRRFARARSRRS